MKMFLWLLIISVLTSVCCGVKREQMTVARLVELGMNLRVSPCTDFYSHVCGSWKTNSGKAGYADGFNYFSISERSMIIEAIAILKEKVSKTDDDHLRKEKRWFSACMNRNSIFNGYRVMQKMLTETEQIRNTTEREWQYIAFYYAAEFSESVFFDIGLNEDNVLRLDRPFIWNSDFDTIYKDLRMVAKSEYGKYPLNGKFENQGKYNRKFLEDFAKIMLEFTQSKEGTEEIMTIEQFQNKYDSYTHGVLNAKMNWLDYLQSIFSDTGRVFKNSDEIEVNLSYFQNLCSLLQSSSNKIIGAYIKYMTLRHSRRMLYSSPSFIKLKRASQSYVCFDGMPIQDRIVSTMFQRKLGGKSDWIKNLFEKLRTMHIEEVQNSWISDDLKESAKKFLENLSLRFHGYYTVHSSEKLSYQFNITRNTIQNIINFNKAQIKHKMETYLNRKSNKRTKRLLEAPAYYGSNSNELFVTPLILLLPVFNISAPFFWNLGNVAFILSHEISHAVIKAVFHEAGAKTRLYFSSKIHCFKNQFNEFKVNGEDTYLESMADYQGLNVAYKLLTLHLQGSIMHSDKMIRGLNFEAKKLFFISFATTFCESPTAQYVLGMTHAPNSIRINEAVSNSIAFAELFNCPSNSKMNPEDKCNLFESSETWITNLYYYLFSDG